MTLSLNSIFFLILLPFLSVPPPSQDIHESSVAFEQESNLAQMILEISPASGAIEDFCQAIKPIKDVVLGSKYLMPQSPKGELNNFMNMKISIGAQIGILWGWHCVDSKNSSSPSDAKMLLNDLKWRATTLKEFISGYRIGFKHGSAVKLPTQSE